MNIKPVELLQVADFIKHPVWEFVNDDADLGETSVRPVGRLPVDTLAGRLVGVQVRLANGDRIWAMVSNVDVHDPTSTEHFLSLSVTKDGKWFHLARYHDVTYPRCGPDTLARFLDLPTDEVFPISYDLTSISKGTGAALSGAVRKEPREKLTLTELMRLSLPKAPE